MVGGSGWVLARASWVGLGDVKWTHLYPAQLDRVIDGRRGDSRKIRDQPRVRVAHILQHRG